MTRIDAIGDTASVSGHTSTTTVAGVGNFTDLLLRAVPGQYNVTIMTPYTLSSLAPLSVTVQVSQRRSNSVAGMQVNLLYGCSKLAKAKGACNFFFNMTSGIHMGWCWSEPRFPTSSDKQLFMICPVHLRASCLVCCEQCNNNHQQHLSATTGATSGAVGAIRSCGASAAITPAQSDERVGVWCHDQRHGVQSAGKQSRQTHGASRQIF